MKKFISTHTSLAGGDVFSNSGITDALVFQPTPPSREATIFLTIILRSASISTHTSLAGGDAATSAGDMQFELFQPTPPSREATCFGTYAAQMVCYFNPHLPRGRRRRLLFLLI